MRASILLVVIVGLFAAGQAIDLKEAGKTLVNTLVQKGKDLLASAAKNLLGSLLDKFGKRDLTFLHDLVGKLGGLLDKGKELASDAFSKAVDKLREITAKFHAKIASLKNSKDAQDAVDDVVAEHHVQHKRIIGDLIQKGKELLAGAVDKIKSLASSLKAKASEVVSGLLQKGTDLLVGKRATLSDHLKTIGGVLSNAVSPFKDLVSGIGSTLKGHFSNLVDTVKGHVTALKGKLSGHVDDIKKHGSTLLEHGKNALGALGEVVKDILQQTVSNAKPAIDGLSKTLADAGKTTLNHFTGADKSTF